MRSAERWRGQQTRPCIQYRLLNRGKGPAVHSLRAQADRMVYREYMKHALEQQENLFLKQGEIVAITTKNNAVDRCYHADWCTVCG